MPEYRRSPITEAVVEFRLQTPVPIDDIKRLRSRILDRFSTEEQMAEFNLHIDWDTGKAKAATDALGFKMVNGMGDALRIITTKSLAFSKLAPYRGWADFVRTARDDFDDYLKHVRRRFSVARIGVRYINRLDIPWNGSTSWEPSEWVTYFVSSPKAFGETTTEVLQVQHRIPNDHCDVIINSALVPSPLILHNGLVVDIDVGRSVEIPQDPDELWALVEIMHGHAGRVFETAITDKTRELLNLA